MNDWMDTLKPGDEVTVLGGGIYSAPSIQTVERLTKTQVVLSERGRKFRRTDGREIGMTGYWIPRIVEVTQEHRDTVENARLRHRIAEGLKNPDLSLGVLRAMAKALKEAA